MFSDMCIDGWEAILSDGSRFLNSSPELQVEGRSPWRELERIAEETNRKIVNVTIFNGLQVISFDANNCKLVTGTATHEYTNFATGVKITRNFRWVRREEKYRWVWGICDKLKGWCVETPVGEEMCPDPYALEEVKNAIP